MKNKQTFLTKGSFALLLFVILGYVVKFYPEQLIPFDSSIQTAIRGDLPAILTTIFRGITRLIDLPIVISWAILLTVIFYLKKWKSESLLIAGNLSLAGILIVSLKHLYQRPRPEILDSKAHSPDFTGNLSSKCNHFQSLSGSSLPIRCSCQSLSGSWNSIH